MDNNKALTQKIGQRLREARKARNLSLAQLSELTGNALSKSRISNYEQGLRLPSEDVIQQLATALGESADYLLCRSDEPLLRPAPSPQPAAVEEEEKSDPDTEEAETDADGDSSGSDMQLTRKIGLRIRAIRNARGLSLAELSERTPSKLSKSRISNYEQGLRRPGLESAQELAQALGNVSATYLLCLNDEHYLTDTEEALLAGFRQLDARGRATTLAVAETQVQAATTHH